MKKNLLFLFIAIAVINTSLHAQSKDYKQKAEEVELKIWGSKDPMFESNVLPEKYKNESIVILAQKHLLESDSKFKFRFFNSGGKLSFYSTIREKVYLNDKASLEEYSQMTFKKIESKTSAVRGANKAYSFMGIRVIKPDGTIQKISIDENAVVLKESKVTKDNKIAVPNLAIGDIVDYYVSTFNTYDNGGQGTQTLTYVLADDAPIVNFNVTLQFDKRLAAEYQCINGSPDFKVKKDADGDGNIIELNAKDLAKIKNIVWSSVPRQIPIARVRYASGEISHKESDPTKKGEVTKSANNPDPIEADIKNAMVKSFLPIYTQDYKLMGMRSGFEVVKKQVETKRPKAINTTDSLAAFAYYYGRMASFYSNAFTLNEDFTDGDRGFSLYDQLMQALRMRSVFENALKIECDFINVAGRNSVTRKNLFEISDLSILLRLHTPKPVYLYIGNSLYNYGEIPTSLEGEQAAFYSIKPKKGMFGNVKDYTVEDEGLVTLPALKKENHIQKTLLTVSLNPTDNQLLDIKRNVTAQGQLRRLFQATLLMPEDIIKSERDYFGYKTTDLVKDYSDIGKAQRKSADEYAAIIKKARDAEKERYEDEIKSEFDTKAKELKSYKPIQLALHNANEDFEIEEEFTMDGWVKKAGNNYIIEAGKFIGGQMEITTEQRDRKLDIYMPYAKSFKYYIEFIIPDGYAVEGLDKLTKKVENETGGFLSNARIEGNKLIVTTYKYYNNIIEKVDNWSKLTAFVDAAFEFNKEKILLKKK